MRKRRSINSSSLSFLDIMACGLGAVILLFFIVDFQEIPEIPDDIPNNNVVSYEEQVFRINEMKDREKILSDEINKMSQQLAKAIEDITFNTPICPVYQNVTASAVTDPNEIKKNLMSQLTAPVRWSQTVHHMIADGVSGFIEVGPGKVLQGLIKKVDRQIPTESAEL